MSTLVFVHAHPDDEASQTSGTIARAVARGDRVVIVYATDGNQGTLPEGEAGSLADLRHREAEASAAITGAQRLVWLPYHDSGMRGWECNTAEGAFMQADVDAVARQIADVLDAEEADAVFGYDWHGGYGHPDHVQVHRVTRRAADLAARPLRYLETTMNRDRMRAFAATAAAAGYEEWDVDAPMDDGNPIGTPQAHLHWAVDITDELPVKRAALAAHASQPDAAGMLQMPPEAFSAMLGVEHYREPARAPGMVEGWPFA
ncbi:MAG TPA: PIG-L family deacetylase [Propioniciclava sp.]|uniref:PIG-L deacetylase family protein n=1 Tax=Propioniciclava sp. TaxID=2038686 RepID=UPI002D0DDF32|nr:PIG-L family deacetylase [Propioniciclava sp.]HRL47802.1 PIG-L family deacetylase [Propioniciclava sp.]HRL79492.1 PIG-L family deacetylase [Propioniciclava sp.]